MGTINDPGDLQREWSILPCTCGAKVCTGTFIEPDIVSSQGSISMSNAEHIVELHNAWLSDLQKAEDSLRDYIAGGRESEESLGL